MPVNLPVRKTMCATCPWREGSPTAYLLPTLSEASLQETRICHSTGCNNAFHARTGLPAHVCRGSRDLQLRFFASGGFLREPTDEEWNRMRVTCGMEPQAVQDPKPKKKKESEQ